MSEATTGGRRRVITGSHWGAGVVETVDGALVGVFDHPDDPDPSAIHGNWAEAVAGSARVRRPAVRAGFLENGPASRERRGAEPFVEVSWDRALDLAAAELARTHREHGPSAVFGGSYGWASAGRFHHAQSQIHRFLNVAGGYTPSFGNYSYHAALVLLPHLVGDFRQSLAEATRWPMVARHGALVVMFGGVPPRSGQVSGGGVARHLMRDQMIDCRRAGVEFISISPTRMDAVPELDAEWLAPRPGSDTALMLALAQTLIAENRHDPAFLARYTVGFDRVEAYLAGETDGVIKDADWAAALTDVPAATIRSLARRMAERRTLITCAAALQRAEHGEQPLWATVTLAAVLGQIGLPGGGYGFAYGADAAIGVTHRPLRWPSVPQEGPGRSDRPIGDAIPVAGIADMLLSPGETYAFNGETRIYPDIRLVWWAGGNPFHHHQDLNKLVRAFRRPETVIVNEIAWTATARHADIVLPVTTTLERTDIGAGQMDPALVPMPQAVAPVGEARDDFDIFAAVARRLGCEQAYTAGRTAREWLEALWRDARQRAAEQDRALPDLDAFLAGDVIRFEDPTPDKVFLEEFRADPAAHPLPTPSGKIELFSETIDSFGYADCPGHAAWLPPTEWLGAPAAAAHPIHLISGQPATRLHSQLDQGGTSRGAKIQGREPVLIHPDDARARGIEDGDIVRLFNDRGACLAGARVTDGVRQGVAFLWTGAWYDPAAPGEIGALDKHGNPNTLTHDRRTSRLSQGPASHSALIEIARYDADPPPITAFDPPIR